MTTSKPLHLHSPIRACVLCFSRHLAISLKLANCISFDTAIPLHTKILVQDERMYVRTIGMALLETIKKKEIGNNLNTHQQEADKKIVVLLHRGPPYPY